MENETETTITETTGGAVTPPEPKTVEADANGGKVFGIELHAGVNFGGFVGGTVNVKNNHQLTLAEETNGIRVRGPKCHKLIPWAALKGVDYFNEDGSEPVSGKSRI